MKYQLTYHNRLRSQGWFFPMYSVVVDGKTAYQSPTKLDETKLYQIAKGIRKPIVFKWDNRLWFK